MKVLLVLSVICVIAFTSCLRSSVSLHRGLEAGGKLATVDLGLSSSLVTTNVRSRRAEATTNTSMKTTKRTLDFIIAGFPKTGTTSLLYTFGNHPETDIAPRERCGVTNPMTTDYVARKKLQEALLEMSPSPRVQRAIKCPNAVYHAYNAIVRMERSAPDTKFVIGLRHPVLMLESYYNYRVTELHDQSHNKTEKMEVIPPLDRLVGLDKQWKGVSTDCTDFRKFLLQFGKTKVDSRDLENMVVPIASSLANKKNRNMAIRPNNFSILLYTTDQLEDTGNANRSNAFRHGLQRFLGLQQPLKPVGRENLNHFVGKKAYPQTVDICLPKYSSLRRMLLEQGARSASWIEQELLQSSDIVIANRDHFLESIRSWSMDPCGDRIKQKKKIKSSSVVIHKAKLQTLTVGKGVADESFRQKVVVQDGKKRVFVGGKRKLEVLLVKL